MTNFFEASNTIIEMTREEVEKLPTVVLYKSTIDEDGQPVLRVVTTDVKHK